MKPDGVATTSPEPADVVEPVPEAAANEEQVQQDLSQSQQLQKPDNESKQEGANSTLPPSGKEEEKVDGKFSKSKDKTKAPVRSKPGTSGAKATTTTGTTSRLGTTQSRGANGVKATFSIGASKKPASMTTEMKSAPAGVKKVPVATVAFRTQVKAAEQKAEGSARPGLSTNTGMRKTMAATTSTVSKKPVTGGSNATSKTTVSKPTHAPAAKTSVSAASKAASIPKTTRPPAGTASRPTTSSALVRPTTTSKSTALRTTASAPSAADSKQSLPSKVSTTVAAKKDIKASTTSAAARKPLASTTRCTVIKASKTELPKPGTAAKRLPTNTKTFQTKIDEARHVPTRKVPPSPQNVSSRSASGRAAADLNNPKQGASSNLVSVTHKTTKPMQSVLPLVIKGKPLEEQSSEPVEPTASLETTVSVTTPIIALVAFVMEVQTPSVELGQLDQQTSALVEGQGEGVPVPALEPTNVEVSIQETIDAEPVVIQLKAQEITEQEPETALPCDVPVTHQVPPRNLEVVEKQEQIIRNIEEDEEEEKECSQPVSVSDMSGTQPTEESRPGSAGLAGPVWRAGGLPSELDSEDVSCSQQGASELSAPGVLEGTESMDDLGEASLKGADGEGVSAGSPDFEKFPDIPVNEDYDEDEDDHVDDMEVGSEMTEDPHRHCDDEDEDVEMASEGVTESGLESYGNDDDDLTEDYRLDNLNRMHPSSIVPTALSSENHFADACMQPLQPDPTLVPSPPSNPWQSYSERPNQPVLDYLNVGNDEADLASPHSPAVNDCVPSSPQPPLEPAADMDMGLNQDHSQCVSQFNISTPEELKDNSISPGLDNQYDENAPTPVALQDSMHDLGVSGTDQAGSKHVESNQSPIPLLDDVQDLGDCKSDQAGYDHEECNQTPVSPEDLQNLGVCGSDHAECEHVESSPTPVAFPDIQDLDDCRSDQAGYKHEYNQTSVALPDVQNVGVSESDCDESNPTPVALSDIQDQDDCRSDHAGSEYDKCNQTPVALLEDKQDLGVSGSDQAGSEHECSPTTVVLPNDMYDLGASGSDHDERNPTPVALPDMQDLGVSGSDQAGSEYDECSPTPVALPDRIQDLGDCKIDQSGSEHDECKQTPLLPEDIQKLGVCGSDHAGSEHVENGPSPVALPDNVQDLGHCKAGQAGSDHECVQTPVALPDDLQNLGDCRSEHKDEHETLPADMLSGQSTVIPSSSSSSAMGNEASDREVPISDHTEPGSTGNECFDGTEIVHNFVEECEEACGEMEGGGSDTPQSATSAASYGFECSTSSSNAQFQTTESCGKSPGIFSLENEDNLLDEAKDPSLIKELNLVPDGASADPNVLDQPVELQLNSEQQYMLCGKNAEEIPVSCSPSGTVPMETGLDSSFSSEKQKDLDLGTPHTYYSTICEKTDSFLTGGDPCAHPQRKVPTVHLPRPLKHHSGLRVDYVTRLPIDFPPRIPNAGCNIQLRRLEQHQQQLEEIEQWREQQSQRAKKQMEEREAEKIRVAGELEQNRKEKENELEDQNCDLLHLQIQQQELKQKQQIMQWQHEMEQQKHKSKHQKSLTTVLLSPSGLCTIYEALEPSDAEEYVEEKELLLKVKVEHESYPKERSNITKAHCSSGNPDSPQSQSTSPSFNLMLDHEGPAHSVALDSPPLSGCSSPEQPSPLELDWSKNADIVQQLINQTLVLNGDSCSPLLLLPSGAGGTLSPLETSLWPSLSALTPPSATVTSVSSFSAEISGSCPQGEWTVVELETHH